MTKGPMYALGVAVILAAGALALALARPDARRAAFPHLDGGLHYALVEGSLRQDNARSYFQRRTRYKVFNTSLTANITLGPVLVVERRGVLGSMTQWNGLAGTIIPPLGGVRFHLKDTGVTPTTPATQAARSPFQVVITWSGALADGAVTGKAKDYMVNVSEPQAVRTVAPLRTGTLP